MRRSSSVAAALATVAAGLATTAAAQTPIGDMRTPRLIADARAQQTSYDPWEGFNRKVYGFNMALDRLIRPGVVFYHHATPHPIRNALHNAVTNCTGPIIFINDVLQLRPQKAAVTLTRFVVNSTVGIAGFNDVAANGLRLPYHNADFGQTLGRYGVASGPYIFLPILGPSTVRDIGGRVVDGFADPLNVVNYDGRFALGISRTVVGGLDARDRADPILKDINRTATDPYAFIRSAYLQNRAAEVRGGDTAQSVQALPDFGPEPATAPAGSNAAPATPAPLPSSAAASQTPPAQQ